MAMVKPRWGLNLKLSVQRVIAMENRAWRASFFTYDKGRLFDDRERAAESVFIQKWERERLEKLNKKKMKMADQQEWQRRQESAVKAETASPEPEKQQRPALG
uniref:Uncharacterized protein n=1 Tax=Picea sitchensis TaxID=3332 RepID=A9NK52_PICSI|nr:unknown [Picea sitchensis]